MWCTRCQNEIADCTCPDINERLASAAEGVGGMFVYKRCKKCKEHYARCKCENPEWEYPGTEAKK